MQPAALPTPQGQIGPSPALQLCGVARSYGTYHALHGVDLAVEAGSFVSLLGPSGSGKTTILRLIAGFEAPTAGRIMIDGRDMTGVPAHRRPVGVVFQNLALFPHLTVGENVAFGLQVRRTPRAEVARRVAAALAMVELPGLERRRVHEMSGGQRQRVALARSLVLQPAVLLLDEPLSALDLKLRQMLQDELKHIQRRSGATFVFVTHDQDEALRLSDRIAVVNRGRIEQVGTADEIYDRPCSAFVARFVGDTNMLPGRIASASTGRAVITLDGFGLTVEAPCHAVVLPGSPAALSVRPENLQLGTPGGMAATVTDVTYAGARVQYALEANGRTLLADVAVRPGSGQRMHPGACTTIAWSADDSVIVPVDPAENAVRPATNTTTIPVEGVLA
jgi:ABC-type Fe3+/spermidine/putrescine transport system ATPase subunit